MNRKILFLFALSVLVFSIPVTGQSFLEKMAKHAKQKAQKEAESRAEKKADEKIDEGIDKAFDHIEKQFEKEKKEETKQSNSSTTSKKSDRDSQKAINENLNNLMSKMGVSIKPVPIKDSYSFNSSVTMSFKSYNKSGKLENDGNIISYFASGNHNIAYKFIDGNIKSSQKEQTGTFIMDYQNKATLILSNEKGKKTGLVYGLSDMADDSDRKNDMKDDPNFKEQEESIVANLSIKKTGRSKSILGYNCDEYKYDDEDVSTTSWITEDVSWDNRDLISNIFSSSINSHGTPNGFLMESTSINKKTGEKGTYTITDIDKSANKTFDITQYQMTNIGSMKIPQSE